MSSVASKKMSRNLSNIKRQ